VTDPLGNVTTTVFDQLNRAVAGVDALGRRSTVVFDEAGRVVATVDALNRRTTTGYDAADRPVTTTDALGKVWTATYDAASNVVSTTDPLNHTATTVYDALNRPAATVDALGDRTTLSFDAAGNLKTVTDARNNVTTFGYDARNLPVTTTDALGNVWTTAYDALGRAVSGTDPLGRTATTVFDAAGRAVAGVDALGNRTTSVYDNAGNMVASVDPLGNRTTTAYDAADRPVSVTDALGNVWTAVYDNASNLVAATDPLGHTTTYVMDALNRVQATVDAQSHRSTAVYDEVGNVVVMVDALNRRTTFGFDALNRPITVTDALGGVSTTTYDDAGNVRSVTDQLNHTTTFGYDARDLRATTTDALGNVWTTAYDAAGNLVSFADPLGHTSTTVYDALNRPVEQVDPLGNRGTTVFDAAGQVSAEVDQLGHRTTFTYDDRGLLRTVTDPLGNVTTTGYDNAGNPVSRTDPRGNTTSFAYDALSRVAVVTDALGNKWTTVYDAAGNATAAVDPLGYRSTAVYDELNRQVATVTPLGDRSTVGYDAVGNAVTQTDPLNHTTTLGYDALDRPVTLTDPLGHVTTATYDAAGNRTSLTDASNNLTTWAYDALNRQTSSTDPLGHQSTTAYDAAGRETGETDRLGRRRDFGYDDANRQTTEKWYASGGGLTQTQTWTYDADGQMLTAQDPDGTYTLTYDAAGRVATAAEPWGLSLTFGYDASGNRTGVEDSKGGITTVTFDELNRQTSEQLGGTGVGQTRFDYAYNNRGDRTSEVRYSDVAGTSVVGTAAYDHDADGRLTHLLYTTAGTTTGEYTYSYDAADRLTAKVEDGTTTTYSYDVADQLTADGAATFGYDATGNRTNSGYATGTGNRTTTDGVWTYTYDAEGNLTKKSKGATSDTWVYTYDNRNQMTGASYSATDGGTVTKQVTYSYDAFGNMIQRQGWDGTTATTERYGLDGWDTAKPAAVGNENFDAWVDLDGSNNLVTRRVWGTAFDEVVARQNSAGTVAWYQTDEQGSVKKVFDNSGTVLATTTYSAYGSITSGSLYDGLGYTGQRLDALTGYVAMGEGIRWYDPVTGKFTSEDPKGFGAGDENLYRYVKNAPTNATDPSGMQDFPLPRPGSPQEAHIRQVYGSVERFQNHLQLQTQSFEYTRHLARLEFLKNQKVYKKPLEAERPYETDAKYRALVDAYEAILRDLQTPERIPWQKLPKGAIGPDFQFGQCLPDGGVKFIPTRDLPHALSKDELSIYNAVLTQLDKELSIRASRYSDQGEFILGVGEAGVGAVEALLHIHELPGAITALLTDEKAQRALLQQLEKVAQEALAGDPKTWGQLTVDIPLTIAGVGGALQAGKVVIRVPTTVVKEIVKHGYKGTDLVRALLKGTREAAAKERKLLDEMAGSNRQGKRAPATADEIANWAKTVERDAAKYGRTATVKKDQRFIDEYNRANKRNARALFDPCTGTIYVGKDATYFEFVHEMFHYNQWKQLSPEVYGGLTTTMKERYVMQQMLGDGVWPYLSIEERQLQIVAYSRALGEAAATLEGPVLQALFANDPVYKMAQRMLHAPLK
jgi:RHS repeat-associated protein